MEWRDQGIIIGGRRYGETSLILEVMTRAHGRHPGLVKGGRARRMQPLLQPGNAVEITWRARLEEHLGTYTIETTRMRGTELMATPAALHGLNLLLSHLRLLAEREPHVALYEAACALLDILDRPDVAPAYLVRFELALLAESGFGLDLDQCAATGTRDALIYVSPKSARAISAPAGEPYKDRLLPLPAFLGADDHGPVDPADVDAGFTLTGFFLDRNLFAPQGVAMPDARAAYIALVRRASQSLAGQTLADRGVAASD
jgi:DNA repair protein RecO (recombination protein O)